MRKIIGTIVLTLGLVVSGAPLAHADEVPPWDPCIGGGTIGTGEHPFVTMLERTINSLTYAKDALTARVNAEQATIVSQRRRITHLRAVKRHQRLVIRRLRHRLANGS